MVQKRLTISQLKSGRLKAISQLAEINYTQLRGWTDMDIKIQEKSWLQLTQGLEISRPSARKVIEHHKKDRAKAAQARDQLDLYVATPPEERGSATQDMITFGRPKQFAELHPEHGSDYYQKLLTGQRDLTILRLSELCTIFQMDGTDISIAIEARVKRHREKATIDQIAHRLLRRRERRLARQSRRLVHEFGTP